VQALIYSVLITYATSLAVASGISTSHFPGLVNIHAVGWMKGIKLARKISTWETENAKCRLINTV